jgi:hypothetical protein
MVSVGTWRSRDSRMGALVVRTRSKRESIRCAGMTLFGRASSTSCCGACSGPASACAIVVVLRRFDAGPA